MLNMALSDSNKVRHGKMFSEIILPFMLHQTGIHDLSNGKKTSSWPWGTPGKRLGSTRSADGVVIDLPTAPKSKTNGDSVVMKVVFSYDNYPEDEIRISRKAGNAGIGAHVYAAYRVDLDSKTRRDIREGILDEGLNRHRNVNLLKGASTDMTPHIYLIIMENLYHNPKRGVTDAKELYDYKDKKPFLAELRRKIDRLHELGIAHGDMHMRNILVQTVKSPTGKTRHVIKIIDYGRSLNRSYGFSGSGSANVFVKGRRGVTSSGGKHYINSKGGLYRLKQTLAWRQVAGSDSKLRPAPDSRSQSYLKSRERSPPSVPRKKSSPTRLPSVNNIPLARRAYGYNVKGRAIHKGPKGGLYVVQGARKIYNPIKKDNSRLKRGPRGGYYYMRGTRKVYV